jgi:hypothetical protein
MYIESRAREQIEKGRSGKLSMCVADFLDCAEYRSVDKDNFERSVLRIFRGNSKRFWDDGSYRPFKAEELERERECAVYIATLTASLAVSEAEQERIVSTFYDFHEAAKQHWTYNHGQTYHKINELVRDGGVRLLEDVLILELKRIEDEHRRQPTQPEPRLHREVVSDQAAELAKDFEEERRSNGGGYGPADI